MKFLDKLNLVIFSIIVLVISLLVCLLNFGFIDMQTIEDGIQLILINNISLIVAMILMIGAIKSTIFNSIISSDGSDKDGILLENDNGKLLVSRDTIESLTNTVVRAFESAENVNTKVNVDNENNIRVFITLFVHPDAIIKDLSSKLQMNVKDAIKKSLDLEVKEVNIKIKNINMKKEQSIKE